VHHEEKTVIKVDRDVIAAFTPTGKLRASINLGNPILANRGADGQPVGVSIDLAREFGKWLAVEVELVVFDSAGQSVEAVTSEQADIGFFAVDPVRGAGISFTAPYVLIEGAYLVREDSPLQDNAEVDRHETRVTVGKGSAYDLYLTRELKSAQIVRAVTSPAVAGVRQQLEFDTARLGGMRLLPGRFMVIQQAMGLPRGRGVAASTLLSQFVEQMKQDRFVAEALVRHGIEGASVAPLAAATRE
jgi:polar amino acid transport system substrate-binding protein